MSGHMSLHSLSTHYTEKILKFQIMTSKIQ